MCVIYRIEALIRFMLLAYGSCGSVLGVPSRGDLACESRERDLREEAVVPRDQNSGTESVLRVCRESQFRR